MLILVTLTPEALIVIFGTMYLLKLVPVDISLAASCVVCGYHLGLQKLNNNSLQWILLWSICLMQYLIIVRIILANKCWLPNRIHG